LIARSHQREPTAPNTLPEVVAATINTLACRARVDELRRRREALLVVSCNLR
jgi:hypothetical protein